MSVVYGREVDDKVTTFGTSGYTFRNTFVLYDRATDSIWFPRQGEVLEAVGGQQRGKRIPLIAQPTPTPLGEWRAAHPNTTVLVGAGGETGTGND